MISVITPTYNRAYILPQCYQSLTRQTSMDFEWIVVDDGSIDKTEQLVLAFINEKKIDITYIKQENGGKHRAHNRGVLAAKGELSVCLDSDDQLTEDAIEVATKYWIQHSKEDIIGILAKRGSFKTRAPICSSWPIDLVDSTMFDLSNKYGFEGDTVLFFRTGLLKNNLFSEFPKEKFLSEANLYYDLDGYGKMLLLNQVLYLCEYLPDGLTAKYHKLLCSNPLGTANTYYKGIRSSSNLKEKVKYGLLTNIYLSLCKDKKDARVNEFDFWVMVTKVPSLVIGKHFLKRFK